MQSTLVGIHLCVEVSSDIPINCVFPCKGCCGWQIQPGIIEQLSSLQEYIAGVVQKHNKRPHSRISAPFTSQQLNGLPMAFASGLACAASCEVCTTRKGICLRSALGRMTDSIGMPGFLATKYAGTALVSVRCLCDTASPPMWAVITTCSVRLNSKQFGSREGVGGRNERKRNQMVQHHDPEILSALLPQQQHKYRGRVECPFSSIVCLHLAPVHAPVDAHKLQYVSALMSTDLKASALQVAL